MTNTYILGIDMGGTNVRAGMVSDNKLNEIISKRINSQGSVDEVVGQLFSLTDELINNDVTSIGIGVPGLINAGRRWYTMS